MKQRTEIIFEVEETLILRHSGKILTAFCPHCEALVKIASPHTIAVLSNYWREREIFRLIEAGKIHFIETDRVLICLNSLPILKEK